MFLVQVSYTKLIPTDLYIIIYYSNLVFGTYKVLFITMLIKLLLLQLGTYLFFIKVDIFLLSYLHDQLYINRTLLILIIFSYTGKFKRTRKIGVCVRVAPWFELAPKRWIGLRRRSRGPTLRHKCSCDACASEKVTS